MGRPQPQRPRPFEHLPAVGLDPPAQRENHPVAHGLQASGGLYRQQPALGRIETADLEEHHGAFIHAQGLMQGRDPLARDRL